MLFAHDMHALCYLMESLLAPEDNTNTSKKQKIDTDNNNSNNNNNNSNNNNNNTSSNSKNCVFNLNNFSAIATWTKVTAKT
jgi:hypothetical protein